MVLGKEADGRFRYRLAGERLRQAMQIRMAGAFLEDVHPAPLDRFVHQRYLQIIDEGCVEYSAGDFLRIEDKWHTAERLVLPLTDDDGVPVFAIGIIEPGPFRRLAGPGDDPHDNYAIFEALPWRYFAGSGGDRD